MKALPNPEYESWETYYLIEPWGWQDQEYRTAALLSMIHNVNVSKKSKALPVKSFMRDLAGEVIKYLEKENLAEGRLSPDLSTAEGRRQATQEVIRGFERMMGGSLARRSK